MAVSTGSEVLDGILDGGLPADRPVLVTVGPGPGAGTGTSENPPAIQSPQSDEPGWVR